MIAFDTEYHDPEMFIADKPKVELRRNMNGSSVISGPRGEPKTNLRNVKSYQPQQTHYETIDLDKNLPGREVKAFTSLNWFTVSFSYAIIISFILRPCP